MLPLHVLPPAVVHSSRAAGERHERVTVEPAIVSRAIANMFSNAGSRRPQTTSVSPAELTLSCGAYAADGPGESVTGALHPALPASPKALSTRQVAGRAPS